jgi:hypothetical protein
MKNLKFDYFKSFKISVSKISILALSSAFLTVTSCERQLVETQNSIDSNESKTSSAKTAANPTELNVNYQNYIVGSGNYYDYTQADGTADLKSLKYWSPTANSNLSVRSYNLPIYAKALRVKMPANAGGVGSSGMVVDTYLADKNEYTMEYRVFFEDGFEFNKGNRDVNSDGSTNYGGGKLPGLTGGTRPSGCAKSKDGMSARIMFRREKSIRSTPDGGYLELYQYWQNQASSCGDRIPLQNVVDNTWYKIKMKVNLGTSSSDGFIQIWINDVQKLNKTYRYLNTGSNWKLNGVMFHSFMGGNSSFWAPTQDRYLMIDDVKVDDNAF